MYAFATDTVDIYNDLKQSSPGVVGRDAYNYEEEDDNTFPAAVNVICFVLEETQTVWDPSSRAPRAVRRITGRLPSGVGVTVHAGTRLVSRSTGVTYLVKNASHPLTPIMTSDIVLDLIVVDAA